MHDKEYLMKKIDEIDRYLSKSIILANAGGIFATLAFIGGRINDNADAGFGVTALVVLVIYFSGSLFAWLALFGDMIRAGLELDEKYHIGLEPEKVEKLSRALLGGHFCLGASVICFLGASIIALYNLYTLA